MTSAAILAGGRARRLGGRDKGAIVIDGRDILARQIDALAPIASEILIVGARQKVEKELAPPDGIAIHFVTDRVAGAGPLGGLDAALAAATGDPVIVVAGDMPYLSTRLLGHLLSLSTTADLVIPRTERGYHPLCAVYARRAAGVVARRLAAHDLVMKHLVNELIGNDLIVNDLRVRVVEGPELTAFGDPDRLLANINTPAQLEEIEALAGHQP